MEDSTWCPSSSTRLLFINCLVLAWVTARWRTPELGPRWVLVFVSSFLFLFGFVLVSFSFVLLFASCFVLLSLPCPFVGLFSSCPLWLLFVCLWLPLLFVLLSLVAAFFLLSPSLGVFTCPSHHQDISQDFFLIFSI